MWVKEELFWQKASAVLFETRKVQLAMAVARVKAYQDQEDGVLYFGCYMISLPFSTCNRLESFKSGSSRAV